MPTVTCQPSGLSAVVPAGTTMLEACQRAGVGVPASCGGKGICGKCRVRILEGRAPIHPGYERALSQAEAMQGWRLACLTPVEEDLVLDTGSIRPTRSVILTEFAGRPVEPDRSVRALPLELPEPSLEDQLCDLGRLARAVGMKEYPQVALPLLQELPAILRRNRFRVTALLDDGELLGVEPWSEAPRAFGLAVDIGTTTIAGALCDLGSGEALALAARTNPQARRGDDVVTRIDHARKGPAERAEMQRLVVEALDEILQETCARAGLTTDRVYVISAGGNTTMHHLLLGLDASAIAESPFIATLRRGLSVRATHIGLRAGHGARLYAVPNLSAYVGGDIVAGILAHDLHASPKRILFLDVGTNGEMALRAGGRTLACATAAGPAFEGARISCGMRAATGAIIAVDAGGSDVLITTVDASPPRGLCGTGLLDAVAVLLDLGIVDETGRMLEPGEVREALPDLPAAIAGRVVEDHSGTAFVLAEATADSPRVALTQRDIREFQLAKGAIAAGWSVLLGVEGLTPVDLDQIVLAGAFGSYLRPESALRTGLLPPEMPLAKIDFVGNSALAGARLCLLSRDMRAQAETIAREAGYLELSGRADFQLAFAEQMGFPPRR